MQDFFCERPEEMNYKELAKRADYFKAEAGGVNTMCELMEKFGERKMEEGRMEGRLEGRAEGRAEERMESARRTATALLALGKLTLLQIAEATQLSLEEVERLAGSTGA